MKNLDPKAVWLLFLGNIVRVPIYIFFIFYTLAAIENVFKVDFGYLNVLWPIVPVWIILSWVMAKLTYKFYKYELREDSFRKEHGVIWKKYVSIPYDRIQNVDIYRGVLARILGLSDLQIQTAGGITGGSYGSFSEGTLVGLSKEFAEELREELIKRAQQSKNQGI